MCITEYNEEEVLAAIRVEEREKGREEGRAECRVEEREKGRVEGRAEGRLEAFVDLVRKGLLTFDEAASELGTTVSEFKALTGLN